MLGGKPELIKNINQKNIIHLIKAYGPISRIELAQRMGISQTAVSKIISKLILKKIVTEYKVEVENRKVGRQPIFLKFNSEALYVLAVAVKRYEFEIVLTNGDGKIVDSVSIKDVDKLDTDLLLTMIETQTKYLLNRKQITKNNLLGIGIAVSGTVSQNKGVVDLQPHYNIFQGFELKKFFGKLLPDVTIHLENDIFAMTQAEYQIGVGKDYKSMALIACTDLGLSIGFIHSNILLRGFNNLAGEVGTIFIDNLYLKSRIKKHLNLDRKLVLDDLLKTESLELVAKNAVISGDETVLSKFAEDNFNSFTKEDIFKAAEDGDRFSIELLTEYGTILGFFTSMVINFYDPQLIVFDAKSLSENKIIFDQAKKVITRHCDLIKIKKLDVKFSKFSHSEIAYGAASLVLQDLFRPFEQS